MWCVEQMAMLPCLHMEGRQKSCQGTGKSLSMDLGLTGPDATSHHLSSLTAELQDLAVCPAGCPDKYIEFASPEAPDMRITCCSCPCGGPESLLCLPQEGSCKPLMQSETAGAKSLKGMHALRCMLSRDIAQSQTLYKPSTPGGRT